MSFTSQLYVKSTTGDLTYKIFEDFRVTLA